MVYNLWGILQLQLAYITISLLIAAGLSWILFRKVGYGFTGGLVAFGLILISLGFAIISISSIIINSGAIEEALSVAVVGRSLQTVGSTLLMIGFYRYYRLS